MGSRVKQISALNDVIIIHIIHNEFEIAINLSENRDLDTYSISVEYWFGDGGHRNYSMLPHGDPVTINGIAHYLYTYTVDVPHTTDPFNYFFSARDTAGNGISTGHAPTQLAITDNDPPTAHAGENVTVFQSEEVILNGSGSMDNIGVTNYTWTFRYNNQDYELHGLEQHMVFDALGTVKVLLVVEDIGGNTANATMISMLMR